MAIKAYRPTTPSRRFMTVSDFSELTPGYEVEKSLITGKKNNAGRNANGRITVRHRGGANKRKYRIIDWKRNKDGVWAKVDSVQYDPNRTANIALLVYEDGEKRYIPAPIGMKKGDRIISGEGADIIVGNAMKLQDIPDGTMLHCIEIYPGRGAQLVRGAGNSARLMAKEGGYAQVRLPSGEVRLIRLECRATIGQIGNAEHQNISIGKAGRKRHMGWRPTVRGSAMNPCDHPHGGGEGKAPVGRSEPVTPWGKPALGLKTRNGKAKTNKFIVRRRKG